MDHDQQQNDKPKKPDGSGVLAGPGIDAVGGALGSAIGLLAEGPAGALLGGAAGPPVTFALRQVAAEIKRRFLSPREEERIATALTVAAERIQAHLAAGRVPRDDRFFDAQGENRSDAEEVVEGILLAAQREHEERKLRYQGNLLANLAFTPGISRARANLLVRWAERLSYRQLLLLSISTRLDEPSIPSNATEKLEDGATRMAPDDLVAEARELAQMGLIFESSSGVPLDVLFLPGHLPYTELGMQLRELMELQFVPASELESLRFLFR